MLSKKNPVNRYKNSCLKYSQKLTHNHSNNGLYSSNKLEKLLSSIIIKKKIN